MPSGITVTELLLSRPLSHPSGVEFKYLVEGTDDEAAALAAVRAETPATYTFAGEGSGSGYEAAVTLARSKISLTPIHVDTVTGVGKWEAAVSYEDPGRSQPPPQPSENSFSFDTTGGTQKITQSIATVSRTGSVGSGGNSATDFKGAIGVEIDGKDMRVNGCEITVPVFRWTETVYKTDAECDWAYRRAVGDLTGTVNAAAFRGYEAGEVLFEGASGARRGRHKDDLWEITFKFAASRNRDDIIIGAFTGIEKKGWEYLWVLYGDDVDTATHARCKTPLGVYVEQVYRDGDFGDLEIGES